MNKKGNIQNIYKLSPMQEGMFFHALLDRESGAYIEQSLFSLKGTIDAGILENSFNFLIRRFEVLRTVFVYEKLDDPLQIVLEERRHKMVVEDISSLSEEEQIAYLKAFEEKDRKRGFDLSKDMLVRLSLFKTGSAAWKLLWTYHHIIMDGWSLGILFKDLVRVYGALTEGAAPVLEPAPRYGDYIKWLETQDKEKGLAYWREYLEGYQQPALLPKRGGSPGTGPGENYQAAGYSTAADETVTAQLTKLAGHLQVTLSSICQTLWGILLQRYNDTHDVVFGSVVSNRPAQIREVAHMVGLFVNTVPVRIRADDFTPFSEVVRHVHGDSARAKPYEYVPLAEIQANSPLKNQLFRHIMATQNFPLAEEIKTADIREETGSHIEDVRSLERTNYDFNLEFIPGKKLHVNIQFNTLVYDPRTVKSIAGQLETLMRQVTENPDVPVKDLEMLLEEDKKRILYHFNDTETDYAKDKTIHQLFQEQAARTGHRVAVVSSRPGRRDMEAVTYRHLNEESNRLAHLLRARGVKPDTVVGIKMGPSVRRIITMLAILKAGGAYLPIDPASPVKRIVAMLEDCRAPLLLTETGTLQHPFTVLKNLYTVRAKPLVTAVRPPLTDLDALPLPDRSLVDYDKYMNRIGQAWVKHSIAIFATRGCPFKCAYCHKLWPKKHVLRSAEHIFEELNLYYEMGVRRFAVVDDIFNLDIKNSTAFFNKIIDNGLKVQLFFHNGMRGDLLRKEYIDLMVKAGTVNVSLALETASPRLQKRIGKNLDIEKFRENLVYLCDTYPQVISELFTMHGFPTETEEEAQKTLDFIKSIKGIHFPYINILRIYSNTNMYRMAKENGVSPEAIFNSENLYFHELPETLPFDRSFTLKLQTDFLNSFFLSKERLLRVLPYQMKTLSEDELVRKYSSFLPAEITSFADLLQLAGITGQELGPVEFMDEAAVAVPHLKKKIRASFPPHEPAEDALRVLLLDLSQFFSTDTNRLDNAFDPPLGLMVVMSYLNRQLGPRVNGRIAKSRVDFDSFSQLRELLEEFKPGIIGIRTLTYYREHFHAAAAVIRQWGFDGPIVTGGPYATANYETLLQDRNIDLVILGEGEVTFCQLVEKMLENGNKLPGSEVLKGIPGLAFVPAAERSKEPARDIILVDECRDLPRQYAPEDLKPVNQPNDLAYVMFTSGSMGTPKGVMAAHRNVVNNVHWYGRAFNLGTGTHLLQMTDYIFDPSVEHIFGSLTHGAVLYTTAREVVLDREPFRRFVRNHNIHIINHVPPVLDELLGTGERLTTLQAVISGGIPLKEAVKDRLIEKGYPLYNNYGPTEITVDALSGRCSGGQVTLGTPIANVKCYIFDRYHRLVPVGVPGELFIGGDGVARGYLNRPELTAESFVEFHRSYRSNRSYISYRSYRTGDLARWQPDGSILFLGRIDRQVKVRGIRIEPGEIENHLLAHAAIREAVVSANPDGSGDTRLCAYIVPHAKTPSEALASKELREYLTRRLPDAMVPAYFVLLEAIPLTFNGKVDMKALPGPEAPVGQGAFAPPGDEIEKQLADIWSRLLDLPHSPAASGTPISTTANFFQLGGHSLKAIGLVSKIHQHFNVQVSLVDVFNGPTIGELAKRIRSRRKTIYESMEPVEKREYYPLSSAQKGVFFYQNIKRDSTAYNSVQTWQLEGDLDREKFQATLKQLIRRHESLRTSFHVLNGQPVQVIHEDVAFRIDYYDTAAGEDHLIKPFDLSRPPLLRVGLIKKAENCHVLISDMHHIITDGVSQEIFMRDFILSYDGKESQLPPLTIQYKDVAVWQNSQAVLEAKQRQKAYWLREFEGEIPSLHMPTDFPRPTVQTFEGEMLTIRLEKELSHGLNRLTGEKETTMFVLLLAAYYVLLFKYSGQEDIVVGSPITGRRHMDLQQIVGMFVNMLAPRNRPAPAKTFNSFLMEVKETVVRALENQDFHFEELVTALGLQGTPGRNPLFNVVFAMQNVDVQQEPIVPSGDLYHLKVSPYTLQHEVAQFDLILGAYQGNDTITLNLRYATSLFKRSTAEKIMDRYVEILEQVVENPGILLEDITVSHRLLSAGPGVVDEEEDEFQF